MIGAGPLVELVDVTHDYQSGGGAVRALDQVSLALEAGTLTAITGPSGSGKSTVLHAMSGLLKPTGGKVRVAGRDLAGLSDAQLTLFRRREVGFVFQAFNLMPALTAWENVAMPAVLDGARRDEVRERAFQLLADLGLASRADRRPGQLSGGELQRVALARALMMEPSLLLADEPTGNLDSASGDGVLEALAASATAGRAVVLVTHDPGRAARAGATLRMRDGRLEASEGEWAT